MGFNEALGSRQRETMFVSVSTILRYSGYIHIF